MIYQLFIIKNTRDSDQNIFNLPEDRQKELFGQDEASQKAVGAEALLALYSTWANEETIGWGVVAFPDAAARVKHIQTLDRIGWYKHMSAFSLLGTPFRAYQPVAFPNPVYKLWLARNNAAAAANLDRLSKAEQDALWAREQQVLEKVGGCYVLACNSFWCSEEYTMWGVNAYPSFEAMEAHGAGMEAMNLPMYLTGTVLMGVPFPQE